MITCNRCGKENQDHYKFCLGCGNELTRPAPAPSPSAGLGSDGPLETARTVLPPAPLGGMPAAMAATVSSGELRNSAGAAKPKGGIPWNDSPKMPAPVPFQLPPNPLAGPAPVPRVTLTRASILSARTILMTVTGQKKREVLEQAIADGHSSKLPIGRVLAEAEQPIDIHWCP